MEETSKETTESFKIEKKKAGIVPLIIFIVGLVTLAAGATFFILDLLKKPDIRTADYLVEIKNWKEQGTDTVFWSFTEIGKGTLTTNNHINDYDFIWRIDDDTLKIETSWLYALNNEYTITIDDEAKTFTLAKKDSDQPIIFEAYQEPEPEAEPEPQPEEIIE